MSVKTAIGPTILLRSGHYFDLLDPSASRFNLGDIAAGIGSACRFAGQCNAFYSVAEHSWHASHLVDGHLRFAALMHDAAEAFIGDVTRPLKTLLPEYKAIEKRIEAVIDDRFALGGLCDHPLVKRADIQMLAAEQQVMMPPHDDRWAVLEGVDVPQITFKWWSPAVAVEKWLERAGSLLNCFSTSSVEYL